MSSIITSIEPLPDLETLCEYTQRLIDSNVLIQWPRNEDAEQYNQIKHELVRIIRNNGVEKTQRRCLYCWVEPVKITDRTLFEFEYKLIIHFKNNLYYCLFKARFYQIQTIHQSAIKYFPSTVYPSVHPDVLKYPTVFRNQTLIQDMQQEETYMTLPSKLKHNGPGRKSFTINTKRQAQPYHLKYFGHILLKCFNCAAYAIQDILYTIPSTNNNNVLFPKDLELLLKHKAFQRLTQWRSYLRLKMRKYIDVQNRDSKDALYVRVANRNIINYKKQKIQNQQFLSNITFYSAMVVGFDSGRGLGFEHWAIIFEGKYHLLCLEFFLSGKSADDDGFVSFKIMPNNIIGQRACWYSHCASYKDKHINAELFYSRWSTLRKTFLPKSFHKEVSFNFIHNLTKIWMSRSEYYMMTSNSQHFCRNIFAVFDEKEASILNIKMDHQKMTLPIPLLPVVNGFKEAVSMRAFVQDIEKKVKYKHEQSMDKSNDIVKYLGVNLFVYDDDKDEQKSNMILDENKIIEQKFDEDTLKSKQIARKLLTEWRIPEHYIDNILMNMIIEDCIRVDDWVDIVDDEKYLVTKLGFTGPHSKRFKKAWTLWSQKENKTDQ
eukprot:25164_1